MSQFEEFRRLAQELAEEEAIRLLSFEVFSPAKAEKIEELEAEKGILLAPELKAFYLQTNGLQLRWAFKNNALAGPVGLQDWDYPLQQFREEEGCFFLLPIERLLAPSPYLQELLRPQEQIQFAGQSLSLAQFYRQMYPLDAFSSYCIQAIYFGQAGAPLYFADEYGLNFEASFPLSVDQYFQFVLQTKALSSARQAYLQAPSRPLSQWSKKDWRSLAQKHQLKQLLFEQEFPLAGQAASDCSTIKSAAMRQRAEQSPAIEEEEWQRILLAHQDFLRAGGAGGQWKMMQLMGQVFGAYQLGRELSKGQQAILDMRRLSAELDLEELQMPYASFCGAWLKYLNFSEAQLQFSLFTDAMLEKAIFAEAQLAGSDFSRACLRGASFVNANLQGADFELADLRGVDFRGAILTDARFPGAQLEGVLR
ncbi:pentapeptide repeat-containing protein [Saprospira grandis]|uniref:Pentapeptide repeat-containing protein n=1 Tax=Saprospira grandis (strain Lewin) TaxID=984262 RepID=H6L1T6_SAPGL|nr:pentapeptide repeat-containing protein [Saprospira grandis]AFC26164.1 pentapeptide repeat-containing protein [Saprospira grandis str. Lewin]